MLSYYGEHELKRDWLKMVERFIETGDDSIYLLKSTLNYPAYTKLAPLIDELGLGIGSPLNDLIATLCHRLSVTRVGNLTRMLEIMKAIPVGVDVTGVHDEFIERHPEYPKHIHMEQKKTLFKLLMECK